MFAIAPLVDQRFAPWVLRVPAFRGQINTCWLDPRLTAWLWRTTATHQDKVARKSMEVKKDSTGKAMSIWGIFF